MPSSSADRPPISPKLALVIGIAAVSTASIFVRFSESNPLIIAGYRMLLASLLMLLLSLGALGQFKKLSKKDLLILLGSGASLAVHFGSFTASLSYTSVAASTVIVDSSPIFVVILSRLLLGEEITKREVIGIALSILGAVIITAGHANLESNLYGDLLALMGSITLATYLVAGRDLRRKMDLAPYTASVYGIAGIFLLTISFFMMIPLIGYPLREYLLFLALAVIPSGLGHNSYNYALKYLKTSIVSVSILGEPIGASILAILFLGEIPHPSTAIGGAMVLSGIYVTVMSSTNDT